MSDNQKAANRPIGIDAFENLLHQLRGGKPNDRSEEDRYYAVVITEVEKAKAVFMQYCSEATEEEIISPRELDKEIAEKIFNKETIWRDNDLYIRPESKNLKPRYLVPHYSTDISCAWIVAEWIKKQTNTFDLVWDNYLGHWECTYREEDFVVADTVQEAICRAALEVSTHLDEKE